MSDYILVGDMHVKSSNLEESYKLSKFILELSNEFKCPIIFEGDQTDGHRIVELEVQKFWYDFYNEINTLTRSISLIGNHDCDLGHLDINSMLVHDKQTKVVFEPYIENNILFVSYCHSNQEFIDICNKYKQINTVICHQSFDGAQVNGYFIPNGINPDDIPQKQIIVGHHHNQNQFGKVWYTGNPRWLTLSDANIDKFIWLIEFDDQGNLIKKTSFDTSNVCKKIVSLLIEEGMDLSLLKLNHNHDNRLDLKGTSSWVSKTKEYLSSIGSFKIRTFITDKKQSIIKESDGINKSFNKWIESYSPKFSDKEKLIKIIKDRYDKHTIS